MRNNPLLSFSFKILVGLKKITQQVRPTLSEGVFEKNVWHISPSNSLASALSVCSKDLNES